MEFGGLPGTSVFSLAVRDWNCRATQGWRKELVVSTEGGVIEASWSRYLFESKICMILGRPSSVSLVDDG